MPFVVGTKKDIMYFSAANIWLQYYPGYRLFHYNISMRSQYFYRPQRSWAKVIFSQACVKNSVHRGEGRVSASVHAWIHHHPPPPGADTPPPGADPLGKQTAAAYGQRAAGTHPTAMHSCYRMWSIDLICLARHYYTSTEKYIENFKSPGSCFSIIFKNSKGQ